MTAADITVPTTDEEMAAKVRPLVNDILARFNEEQLSPSEAGMVILSLTYRLMEVLKEAPEARRFFILTLINLINTYLAEEMEAKDDSQDRLQGLVQEEHF